MRAGVGIALTCVVGLLAACEEGATGSGDTVTQFQPDYSGVQTRLLDGDLVNFAVTMRGARGPDDVTAYAECAAAQYTLIRGYGFARHVRTNVEKEGGLWRADAVYTISAALPPGLRTLDAEVVAADCAENGIPMV